MDLQSIKEKTNDIDSLLKYFGNPIVWIKNNQYDESDFKWDKSRFPKNEMTYRIELGWSECGYIGYGKTIGEAIYQNLIDFIYDACSSNDGYGSNKIAKDLGILEDLLKIDLNDLLKDKQ